MSRTTTLLDAVFIARPILWVPVWGFCGFGYYRAFATRGASGLTAAWSMEQFRSFWGVFWFSAAVGAVYILNQMADLVADSHNDGFPLMARAGIERRVGWRCVFVFGLLSLTAPALVSCQVPLFSAVALLVGVVYSFRPLRLSGRPLADFITNAVGYGLVAFGVGWHLGGAPLLSAAFLRSAGPYVLLMCAGSIASTFPDLEGDMADGKNTTPVVFGIGPSLALASILLALGTALAVMIGDGVAVAAGAVALPLYAAYGVRRTRPLMEATYKVGGAASMVLAAIVYPIMVGPAVLTLGGTWLYFRLRHGISYPSLIPVDNEQTG